MNFTREPIIETVITPREGCKLVIRNSKGSGQEDYYVDAIEVVSFGTSIFYRSTERPKSFILPVGDYEVLELKETRMVLKSIGVEKSIKIGGGTPAKAEKIIPAVEDSERETKEPISSSQMQESNKTEAVDRKRDKRRSRRRRGSEMKDQALPSESSAESKEENPSQEPASSSMISRLFPPPPTLIKEKLNRYKDVGVLEANLLGESEKPMEEIPAPDVLEFGNDQGFFREEPKEEILPEDLEPNNKGVPDEPVYNPENYEEQHPTSKVKEEEEPPEEK